MPGKARANAAGHNKGFWRELPGGLDMATLPARAGLFDPPIPKITARKNWRTGRCPD